MVTLDVSSPVDAPFRQAVADSIGSFLGGQAVVLAELGPGLEPLIERARLFIGGGKRLRPGFCVWGYAAVTGSPDVPDAVLTAAASLDVLHVSALMHDDVMDASDHRRGVPAAHRQFEADHRREGWRGDAEAFGRAGAILLGDLLLVWSQEMFEHAGLDAAASARARVHLEAVRTEVTAGQYLDVVAQAQHPDRLSRTPEGRQHLVDLVRRVVTWKTASYSVRRPLLIGASLAGGSAAQLAALSAFAEPLGRAFQYRDDVLGVFGDESLTGKNSGEDLREGKLTLLAAEAFARVSDADAARLAALFGRPDLDATQVEQARSIILGSGALDAVEAEIAREYAAALAALDAADVSTLGLTGLRTLARQAVERDF